MLLLVNHKMFNLEENCLLGSLSNLCLRAGTLHVLLLNL